MSQRLKAAVVGASGIGKHHAKWYAVAADCDVTAIYGTTEASAGAAAAALRDLFGFEGRAFHDWDAFVAEGDFELCSVCSPATAHYANVVDLVAAGKHILCEKPLVWYWDRGPEPMRRESRDMVARADAAGVILAVNAQYPAGLPAFAALHRQVLGRAPDWSTFVWEMESKGKPRHTPGPQESWVDLGPHALTMLEAIHPAGAVDWDTLQHQDGPTETRVTFDWVGGDGQRTAATLDVRRITEGDPKRRFGTRGLAVDYAGRNQDGEFVAVLSREGREEVLPDFMRTSVERFAAAVRAGDPSRVLVSGAAGLRQAEALVGVWARCW